MGDNPDWKLVLFYFDNRQRHIQFEGKTVPVVENFNREMSAEMKQRK